MNQTFTPPVAPPPVMPPVCAVNPVVGAIKRLGRSPLFLCLCIFQTVAAGLTLIASLDLFSNNYGVFSDLLEDMEGLELSADSGLLSFVFPALFALGLWLIRAACKNNGSPFVTTGGLKTVKVLVTIQLVFMYIVAGCIPLFLLGVFALGGALGDVFSDPSFYGEFDEEFLDEFSGTYSFSVDECVSTGLISILAVVLLVVLAVLVYMIIYYHSLRRGVTTLIENAEGILTDRSFSMFTIVTFYIMGSFAAFSALTSLVIMPVAALSSGAMAVAYILGGVLMGRYRKEMEHLRMASAGQVPPPPFEMGQPPFVPQPQPAPVPQPEFVPAPVPVAEPASVADPVPVADPAPAQEPIVQSTVLGVEFCSECGRKRGEDEKFCPGCGKPFSN